MSEHFSADAVVIGGGAVGLAIGRALALAGHETILLEKNRHVGMETSARNSEVIHAGIYYPKDSLKARFCVAGREMLYGFCESHGVGHKRLGKLIVGALNARDYTLLQGLMIIFAFCVIIVNTLTDLAYGLVDPRVKYE